MSVVRTPEQIRREEHAAYCAEMDRIYDEFTAAFSGPGVYVRAIEYDLDKEAISAVLHDISKAVSRAGWHVSVKLKARTYTYELVAKDLGRPWWKFW